MSRWIMLPTQQEIPSSNPNALKDPMTGSLSGASFSASSSLSSTVGASSSSSAGAASTSLRPIDIGVPASSSRPVGASSSSSAAIDSMIEIRARASSAAAELRRLEWPECRTVCLRGFVSPYDDLNTAYQGRKMGGWVSDDYLLGHSGDRYHLESKASGAVLWAEVRPSRQINDGQESTPASGSWKNAANGKTYHIKSDCCHVEDNVLSSIVNNAQDGDVGMQILIIAVVFIMMAAIVAFFCCIKRSKSNPSEYWIWLFPHVGRFSIDWKNKKLSRNRISPKHSGEGYMDDHHPGGKGQGKGKSAGKTGPGIRKNDDNTGRSDRNNQKIVIVDPSSQEGDFRKTGQITVYKSREDAFSPNRSPNRSPISLTDTDGFNNTTAKFNKTGGFSPYGSKEMAGTLTNAPFPDGNSLDAVGVFHQMNERGMDAEMYYNQFPPGRWDCNLCQYKNPDGAFQCVACHRRRGYKNRRVGKDVGYDTVDKMVHKVEKSMRKAHPDIFGRGEDTDDEKSVLSVGSRRSRASKASEKDVVDKRTKKRLEPWEKPMMPAETMDGWDGCSQPAPGGERPLSGFRQLKSQRPFIGYKERLEEDEKRSKIKEMKRSPQHRKQYNMSSSKQEENSQNGPKNQNQKQSLSPRNQNQNPKQTELKEDALKYWDSLMMKQWGKNGPPVDEVRAAGVISKIPLKDPPPLASLKGTDIQYHENMINNYHPEKAVAQEHVDKIQLFDGSKGSDKLSVQAGPNIEKSIETATHKMSYAEYRHMKDVAKIRAKNEDPIRKFDEVLLKNASDEQKSRENDRRMRLGLPPVHHNISDEDDHRPNLSPANTASTRADPYVIASPPRGAVRRKPKFDPTKPPEIRPFDSRKVDLHQGGERQSYKMWNKSALRMQEGEDDVDVINLRKDEDVDHYGQSRMGNSRPSSAWDDDGKEVTKNGNQQNKGNQKSLPEISPPADGKGNKRKWFGGLSFSGRKRSPPPINIPNSMPDSPVRKMGPLETGNMSIDNENMKRAMGIINEDTSPMLAAYREDNDRRRQIPDMAPPNAPTRDGLVKHDGTPPEAETAVVDQGRVPRPSALMKAVRKIPWRTADPKEKQGSKAASRKYIAESGEGYSGASDIDTFQTNSSAVNQRTNSKSDVDETYDKRQEKRSNKSTAGSASTTSLSSRFSLFGKNTASNASAKSANTSKGGVVDSDKENIGYPNSKKVKSSNGRSSSAEKGGGFLSKVLGTKSGSNENKPQPKLKSASNLKSALKSKVVSPTTANNDSGGEKKSDGGKAGKAPQRKNSKSVGWTVETNLRKDMENDIEGKAKKANKVKPLVQMNTRTRSLSPEQRSRQDLNVATATMNSAMAEMQNMLKQMR